MNNLWDHTKAFNYVYNSTCLSLEFRIEVKTHTFLLIMFSADFLTFSVLVSWFNVSDEFEQRLPDCKKEHFHRMAHLLFVFSLANDMFVARTFKEKQYTYFHWHLRGNPCLSVMLSSLDLIFTADLT